MRTGIAIAISCVTLLLLALAASAGPIIRELDEPIVSDTQDIGSADDKSGDGFLGQLLVFLQPGTDPVAFGRAYGLTYLDTLKSDPNAHTYLAGTSGATTTALTTLSSSPLVRVAFENRRTHYVPFGFVPNDAYFHKETPTRWTGPGQWHLRNEYVAGRDINITPAWDKWMTGYGVNMAVVDDCLQRTHPDLAPNYLSADSYDFHDADADPSPVSSADRHGVATAGVAAARGGNSIGVTGVAPYSRIAGLRVSFEYDQTTAMFVDADIYHSSGDNTSIKIKNHSYGYDVPYISTNAEFLALATSTGAGTINIFAAGNERGQISQDSNTKMNQSCPYVITVAALGSDGLFSDYSCFGANVFCTAPSSSYGDFGITTTDRTGGYGYNGNSDLFPDDAYTSIFGGTSSAAPAVAGAMAVVKQVQPALDKRLAKHLLARTCRIVDSTDSTATSDGGWKTNGAGYKFNQNYGFGLIDVDALCYQARRFRGVSTQTSYNTGLVTVGASIPDGSATALGVTRSFSVTSTTALEEVVVYLDITHPSRGNVEAYLTSPSGTTSRLMYRCGDTGDNIKWSFTSNAFWGENPAGTWYLNVRDVYNGSTGTWNKYRVYLYMGYPLLVPRGPTVTINQSARQSDPSDARDIEFKVVFSEWVTDFASGDVQVSGTAGPTTATVYSGYGREYYVRVSGMRARGTVIATVPSGVAHNARGYSNSASTSTDNVVTYNVAPKNVYISPSSGSLPGDTWTYVSAVYSDSNGAVDISKAYLHIGPTRVRSHSFYLMYDANLNLIYLRNDEDTSWGTGKTPGSATFLSNPQGYLSLTQCSAVKSGNNLVMKYYMRLWSGFTATLPDGWMFVQDKGMRTDGWDQMASW